MNWKVLIVEDDRQNQVVTQELLVFHNLEADVASTVDEALKMLAAASYDAAVIDLSLPGRSGWELLAEIQQHPRTAAMPCIAITAYHSPKVAENAIASGFWAYFSKPIQPETFVEDLLRCLAETT